MSPRMFSLLAQRHEVRLKREDRRSGGIIAALYNIHTRSSESDTVHDWTDFFREWQPVQSEDEMYKTMLVWTGAPGGLTH